MSFDDDLSIIGIKLDFFIGKILKIVFHVFYLLNVRETFDGMYHLLIIYRDNVLLLFVDLALAFLLFLVFLAQNGQVLFQINEFFDEVLELLGEVGSEVDVFSKREPEGLLVAHEFLA